MTVILNVGALMRIWMESGDQKPQLQAHIGFCSATATSKALLPNCKSQFKPGHLLFCGMELHRGDLEHRGQSKQVVGGWKRVSQSAMAGAPFPKSFIPFGPKIPQKSKNKVPAPLDPRVENG